MLRYEIPPQICKTLINNRITKIIRRGKYLIFLLNNQSAVLCHLGMTGCFRISRDYVKRKHDHFIMGLKNKQIIFNDINSRIDFLENTLNQAGSISEKFSIEKQLMLKNKISDLIDDEKLDESRLIQEVAYYIERSDITEEIVRSKSHIHQIRKYLENEAQTPPRRNPPASARTPIGCPLPPRTPPSFAYATLS